MDRSAAAPIPAVRAVFEKSRAELRRRIATLHEAVAALLVGDLDEDLRQSAECAAHKLAGSLGMFGFPRGSELARELELTLASPQRPADTDAARLASLVQALDAELERPPPGSAAYDDAPAPDNPALLLVSPDEQLLERLSAEAVARNLRPRSASTAAAALRSAAAQPPDVAVLDVSFGRDRADGLELLAQLAGREPSVPVLVLTASDAIVDRVEVAKRGGRGFISRSGPASQVIDAVSEQIERHRAGDLKVLAVDDDPTISAGLRALLAPSGITVSTLNDPLRFWDALEEVGPDLVILDLDMPNLNGIDLCRAVRADARFGQLPVLFLTAHSDADHVQRIFEAGADDYVSKPIVGPELVTRVFNRWGRVRRYRDLAEKDGLTGVASRRRANEALEDLIEMGARLGQPTSVAMLDLDHFKLLNDRLGHAAGDAALRRIGKILLGAFRGQDVVGRWGGEEFIVGMYATARDDAVQRVAEVLESFRHETFIGRDGRTAQLSFSAGVAEFPHDGTDLQRLVGVADAALYSAKAAGRARVLAAASSPRAPHGAPSDAVRS
ncbi:MAG: diguanylate cyclase [Solirubrobacteraceae bacterium]